MPVIIIEALKPLPSRTALSGVNRAIAKVLDLPRDQVWIRYEHVSQEFPS